MTWNHIKNYLFVICQYQTLSGLKSGRKKLDAQPHKHTHIERYNRMRERERYEQSREKRMNSNTHPHGKNSLQIDETLSLLFSYVNVWCNACLDRKLSKANERKKSTNSPSQLAQPSATRSPHLACTNAFIWRYCMDTYVCLCAELPFFHSLILNRTFTNLNKFACIFLIALFVAALLLSIAYSSFAVIMRL